MISIGFTFIERICWR